MAFHCGVSNSLLILPFLFWLLLAGNVNAEPHRHRRLMSSPPPTDTGSVNLYTIIGSASLIVFLILFSVCICMRRSTAQNEPNAVVRREVEIEGQGAKQFDLETMKAATSNFSIANMFGDGRFVAVYRGKLHNGQEVAIKRLLQDSQREIAEFTNEVRLVAKLQHTNLVKLVGYCAEGEERMLVCEFVPNLSLARHLFDQSKSKYLTWEERHKVILGIGSGLQYLHEVSQLATGQCDLKASNILLEQDLNPKISNFGMAGLVAVDQSQGNFGTGPSVSSDVYSFGVVLLEIVSGQNGDGLAVRARKLWEEGRMDELVDPTLSLLAHVEARRCIQIGFVCVGEDVAATTPTMQAVLLMLNNSSTQVPSPFWHSEKNLSTR